MTYHRFTDGLLDEELFRTQEKDGLTLFMPKHSIAVSNDGWNQRNAWFRSRIETPNGDTVSQGFGKFFNLGMGPDGLRVDTSHIIDRLRDGVPIVASLKYDGSCLIRSVYKGRVIFRTRGSFSYEHHDKAKDELDAFFVKYPKLNDPSWMPTVSLLFEWVTPENQIVIKYDEAELYLIGGVDHGHRHLTHVRYLTIQELSPISTECGIQLMEFFEIKSKGDWYNFYHEVINHRDIEGYVLRMDDEQILVKVKAQAYLTKHGLKSNLSFKSMVEFWLQHGGGAHNELLRQVENMYDEEVVMWALPFVMELEDAIKTWQDTLAAIRTEVTERSHWARKDFAIEMQKKYASDRLLFSLAMVLWQGGEPEDRLVRTFMQRFDKMRNPDA